MKHSRQVTKIPMLGTGKTDLKDVRTLALELTKEAGTPERRM